MNFVRSFMAKFEFTGQIGFDCIVDESKNVWILEGNPRATSGLHLFEQDSKLVDALLGHKTEGMVVPDSDTRRMLIAAMPIWGLDEALGRRELIRFVKDSWRGKDVLFSWNDPLPFFMLPITMGELVLLAFQQQRTLQQVSTQDIEWNGESI